VEENVDEAQTITNENKCTGFVDNSQVKRKRPNPTIRTPKEKCWRQTHLRQQQE
jgi:hypothetical protein